MASNATISRYRPALAVLAALAAGYTIYYVHSTRQASVTSREPSQRIRRRQANNRRRARPAQIEELISHQTEELTAFLDYPESTWDAKRLFDEWRACPERFEEAYLLPQKHWPERDVPATLLLRKELPSLSWLMREFEVSVQDAQTILKDYEETMLRTFICQKVPPRCTLVDDGGLDMFTRAFSAESECLSYPGVIRSTILLFNVGAYDYWTVRKDTYLRFRVQPPGVRGPDEPDLEQEPLRSMERTIEYVNDPEGFERLDEPLDDADDISESIQSWHEDDSDDTKKEGAQTLLNMLYHIAEDQARREGFVHRGISCKNCATSPIHGLRYKCINCVNFDLCETCEAMQQHNKTHLFLKIRVPTPAYTNSKKPEALWYPGKSIGLPNNLKPQRNKLLSEDSGFNENEIEALWDQFKNLAATPWSGDPLGFCWAIDRLTFHRCFALSTGSTPRGHPTSLIYDRLFRLYDSNRDGLIGFEEFVNGMAASRSRNPEKRMKRTFDGFDFDEDGFISRKDVLAIFKACYALSKDLARDLFTEYEVDLLDGGSLRDNITGNQPISSAFTGMYDSSDRHRRIGQGKTRDANGDLIITDSGGILSSRNNDEGDLDQIIGDLKEISIYGNYSDSAIDVKPSENIHDLIPGLPQEGSHIDGSLISPPSAPMGSGVENNLLQQATTHDEDNNENDRRWVFFEGSGGTTARSNLDRKTVRQEAVTDRNSRAQFYDEDGQRAVSITRTSSPDGSALHQLPDLETSKSEDKDDAKTAPSSISNGEAYNAGSRIPPPMPEDIGQEMLFQITRECINELIDPLFRHREDLKLCFEHFKEFFESCKDHIELVKCASIDSLTPDQVKIATQGLAWFQLQRFLKARAENPNVFGHGDNHPLIKFLESTDEVGSSDYKTFMADKVMIRNQIDNGKEVPYMLDYPPELLQNKVEPSKIQHSQLSEIEAQATPSLSSGTSQPEESEVEYPTAAMDLHETVRLFNENDNVTMEENISNQDLDILLEDSGYGIITDEPTTSQPKNIPQDSPADPTLPQNRPNSLPSITISSTDINNLSQTEQSTTKDQKIMLPKPFNPQSDQYVPPVSSEWSKEFRSFLRFLIVLERAHQDDLERGGPGRINFKEYADIVGGATNGDLEFLGQWIDMQAM